MSIVYVCHQTLPPLCEGAGTRLDIIVTLLSNTMDISLAAPPICLLNKQMAGSQTCITGNAHD